MVGLDPGREGGGLHLHEVADVYVVFEHGARPDAGEGTDDAVAADDAALQVAVRADYNTAGDRHAGAEHHVRLDGHVRLECRVGLKKDRSGVDHGDAGIHRGDTQPALHHGLGSRQFGARVYARHLLGRGFDGDNFMALGPRQDNNIREVIFGLRVVVAHRSQPACHVGRGGAQHAGVAQPNGALCVVRVGPFDDAFDGAVRRDHATVLGGVGRAEGQQPEAGIAPVPHVFQRRRADQRIIGIEDRDLAMPKMLDGLQRGVGGAQAFVLHHANVGRRFLADRIHVGAEDNDDAVEHALATRQQMPQHAAAGNLVQRLGEGGLHPRPQTRGQNNGSCRHECPYSLSVAPWLCVNAFRPHCRPRQRIFRKALTQSHGATEISA